MNPMEIEALYHGLAALTETGLLDSLAEGFATVEEHATNAGTDPDATRVVLGLFIGHGLVVRDGDRVKAASSLVMRAKAGEGPESRIWAHLPKWLESGETLIGGGPRQRGEVYANVVDRLARMFAAGAARLGATLVDMGVSDVTVLDVGAGSGVFGLAVLEACGGSLVAQDLPEVLPRVEARAAALDLSDKVSLLAGDFHSTALPRVDLALLANVLHLEPPERAEALLSRVAEAVRPGGRVVIVDALGNGNPARCLARDAYAVHLALRNPGGRPHPDEELRAWLEPYCATISQVDLDTGIMGAMIGVRR